MNLDLQNIYHETLERVGAERLTTRSLEEEDFSSPCSVLAVGKASVPMARAAYRRLGNHLENGFLLTKYDHTSESDSSLMGTKFEFHEAAHPVPDEKGLKATEKLRSWLQTEGKKGGELLVLLSGGASSLLVAPTPPLDLAGLQEVNRALLHSGLPIETMNVLRKHLSSVKGGQLGSLCTGFSRVRQMIMVDICCPELSREALLSLVGSGPFCPDPSTEEEARGILAELKPDLPEEVFSQAVAALHDTPKELPITSRVVGSHEVLREAAVSLLGDHLLDDPEWPNTAEGYVDELAARFARIGKRLQAEGKRGVLIATGEPLVNISTPDPGRGGRCQELALQFARHVSGHRGLELLAGSSDGTDGPTTDAGAHTDGNTWPVVCHHLGQEEAVNALSRHDSGFCLSLVPRALLTTGPTGQNLNDLYLLQISE